MSVFLAQFWATVRQNPFVSVCLALAVLAGAANYPLWQKRRAITEENEVVRRRGETMVAALTDRARINSDLATLAEAQEAIDVNLVSEESMEVNLGYFYRLEKLNRVRVLRIDQMATPASTGEVIFKTVPITLQVAGTYRNALAFMRELETGPRLLRTRSYRLERQDATGNDLMLFLTVEMLAQPR